MPPEGTMGETSPGGAALVWLVMESHEPVPGGVVPGGPGPFVSGLGPVRPVDVEGAATSQDSPPGEGGLTQAPWASS